MLGAYLGLSSGCCPTTNHVWCRDNQDPFQRTRTECNKSRGCPTAPYKSSTTARQHPQRNAVQQVAPRSPAKDSIEEHRRYPAAAPRSPGRPAFQVKTPPDSVSSTPTIFLSQLPCRQNIRCCDHHERSERDHQFRPMALMLLDPRESKSIFHPQQTTNTLLRLE